MHLIHNVNNIYLVVWQQVGFYDLLEFFVEHFYFNSLVSLFFFGVRKYFGFFDVKFARRKESVSVVFWSTSICEHLIAPASVTVGAQKTEVFIIGSVWSGSIDLLSPWWIVQSRRWLHILRLCAWIWPHHTLFLVVYESFLQLTLVLFLISFYFSHRFLLDFQ